MKKKLKRLIPPFAVSLYHLFMAYLGAFLYGFPSRKMAVIGVLGTRGKTTTANFVWSVLEAAGFKTGLVGTANIRIGKKERLNQYHMTMPGRFILQKILAEMLRAGCKYAIIETPSEGVEQWRHKGIFYDMAVMTTLYPEYLEAHSWSWERCKKMHAKVFADLKQQPRKEIDGKKIPKVIVVNADIEEKNIFLQFRADQKITYGLRSGADYQVRDIEERGGGVAFTVDSTKYEISIPGAFNAINALAAIAVVSALGISKNIIARGLKDLGGVPGRMEKIEAGQTFTAMVDYAHDEISLKSALEAARGLKQNQTSKIILVLGAEGGGRDKKKRPVMGELAAKLADYAVISNVDSYDDNPEEIIEDIARSAEKSGKVRGQNLFTIEERREGIHKALILASNGDVVLITGKGAEQSMVTHGKKTAWDDRTVTRQELEKIVV